MDLGLQMLFWLAACHDAYCFIISSFRLFPEKKKSNKIREVWYSHICPIAGYPLISRWPLRWSISIISQSTVFIYDPLKAFPKVGTDEIRSETIKVFHNAKPPSPNIRKTERMAMKIFSWILALLFWLSFSFKRKPHCQNWIVNKLSWEIF